MGKESEVIAGGVLVKSRERHRGTATVCMSNVVIMSSFGKEVNNLGY